ncbi:Matrixin [Posidoniimonas corsicana]|uniref:Matrixin n=1 Tax=Posidoniimonas corsicana TaxID=1938618 RepID=A0A5C5UZM2_9BACT|nr:matrixin family metalloprotease [Posidoniimonas corsicana]TWT31070.1 Matrixin [Posidoniimonas corsicana]
MRSWILIGAALPLLCGPCHAYYSNGRWVSTATDGTTQGYGLPVTLTWSVVPDGTSLFNAVGGQSRPSDLIADLDDMFGHTSGGADLTERPWFEYVEQSFRRWGEVSGVTLVYEANDDGVTHGLNINRGQLGVRGDIRLGGTTIDGPGGTYGQAGFLPNADVMLDTSDVNRFSDPTLDYFYLRNTLTHEIGHSLGLGHTESPNSHVLMTPYATESPSYDGPQQDDIRGVHYLYGDAFERGATGGNGSFAAASPLGALSPGGQIAIGGDAPTAYGVIAPDQDDFVSIAAADDEDFFFFTVDAPLTLDLTVQPRGWNYAERAFFNDPFVTVEANSQADLSVELYREGSPAPTLVASASAAALGEPESISGLSLVDPGSYYVRVVGDREAVQLYGLTLAAAAGLAGDYNADGAVDASDYTVWRDRLGSGEPLPNETASPGVVDAADYAAWRAAFGSTALAAAPVPSPQAGALLAALAGCCSLRRTSAAQGRLNRFFTNEG